MATESERIEQAVINVVHALGELVAVWDGDAYDMLNNVAGYPFGDDLEEVHCRAIVWWGAVRNALANR